MVENDKYYHCIFAYKLTSNFIRKTELIHNRRIYSEYLRLLMLIDYHKSISSIELRKFGLKDPAKRVFELRQKGLVHSRKAGVVAFYTLSLNGELLVQKYKDGIDELFNLQMNRKDEQARRIESKRRADEIFGVSGGVSKRVKRTDTGA